MASSSNFVDRAEPVITVGDNQLARSVRSLYSNNGDSFSPSGDLGAIFFHMAIADPEQ